MSLACWNRNTVTVTLTPAAIKDMSETIIPSHLFYLRVLLQKTAFSQPYVNVGKQYVLTVTQLLCLDTSRLCYAKF